MKTIGDRIGELREKYDLTKTEMAKRLGVSRSAITRYESGEMNPTLDVMIKIRNSFNVTMDWIVGFDNDENTEYNKVVNECKKSNISPEKLEQIMKLIKDK